MLRTRRAHPPKRRPWSRSHERHELAAEWLTWAADNLLRGNPPERIEAALRGRGVPGELARREVARLAASPALVAGRRHAVLRERHELVARLLEHQASLAAAPGAVETRARCDADELFERYYCRGAPVVLTELIDDWPALRRWGLDDLEARFGDVAIEITAGRDDDPDCDLNFERHLEALSVRAFVERLRQTRGESNDFYLIANNHALDRTALGALLDDVRYPSFIAPGHRPGCASLWIGPGGTRTPLHHDTCSILFCQVVGRKRFRLLPPYCAALLEAPRGYYSGLPPERVDELPCREVVLEPGMALFLPVGWWHEVRALELSMSLSLLDFKRPNGVDWYAPGKLEP